QGIPGLVLPHFGKESRRDTFQNYVVRTAKRDSLREHLRTAGVETLVHWPKPVWEHKDLGLSNPNLPRTKHLCEEVLSLPMSAETTVEQADIVAEAIRQFFQQ